MTLTTGARTKFGLFFSQVCSIHVFDQTLTEQLYRDKGAIHLYHRYDSSCKAWPQTQTYRYLWEGLGSGPVLRVIDHGR